MSKRYELVKAIVILAVIINSIGLVAAQDLATVTANGAVTDDAVRIDNNGDEQTRIGKTLFVDGNTIGRNVGVAVNTPLDRLHVNGGAIRVEQNAPKFRFFEKDTTDQNWEVRVQNGFLQFRTADDAFGSATNRFVVDPLGFFGIGTNSPTNELDVNGEVRIRTVNQDDALNDILVQDPDGVIHYRDAATLGGGTDGVSCWDLNENFVCDLGTEDINSDLVCDVLDCAGADGADGADGTDGQDGSNGTNGISCWDLNENGACDLGTEDLNTDLVCDVLDCEGPAGPQGIPGVDGLNGTDGQDGIDGVNGTDGAPGPQGPPGQDGINGTNGVDGLNGSQGPPGVDGLNGTNGIDGTDGLNGTDGFSCWDLNQNFICDLGTEDIDLDLACTTLDCAGSDGANGTRGPQGPPGQDGTNGTDGLNGVDGINGTNGVDGLNGTDGAQGPPGIDGLNGTNGQDGLNGTDGINGTDGQNGSQGPAGPTLGIFDSLGLASSGNLSAGDAGNRDIFNLGNTGVGVGAPAHLLHVFGDARITGNLFVGTGTVTINDSGILFPDGSFQEVAAFNGQSDGDWNASGNDIVQGNQEGNVGIGTDTPSAKLDVEVTSGGAATIGDSSNTASGDFAVAMGLGATASGPRAIAMGSFTTASQIAATAMGANTNATGSGATAMGIETDATGASSTAMGTQTTASGDSAVAMGTNTNATGPAATAMGQNSVASGSAAVALGDSALASGSGSVAIGPSVAQGTNSVALGTSGSSGDEGFAAGFAASASGTRSVAIGQETAATALRSTALGSNIAVSGDNSFGIGLDTTTRTITQPNTMAIMGGNVGIGTLEPSAKLDVEVTSGGAATFGSSSNSATGLRGVAIGSNNQASGENSFAHGGDSVAAGEDSFASGFTAQALLANDFARGQFVTASGSNSIAMGTQVTASALQSIAMGTSINVNGVRSFGIGLSSDASTISQPSTMAIMHGHVGLNVTSPTEVLDVQGKARIRNIEQDDLLDMVVVKDTDGVLHFRDASSLAPQGAGSAGNITFWKSNNELGNSTLYDSSGRIGIGTLTPFRLLDVRGRAMFSFKNQGSPPPPPGSAGVPGLLNILIEPGEGGAASIGNEKSSAPGDFAVAIGFNSFAEGDRSVSIGTETNASASRSIALGQNIKTEGTNSVGIGLDTTPRTITDSNTMAIMGGDVGIGSVSPDSRLTVRGDGDTQITVQDALDADRGLTLKTGSNGEPAEITTNSIAKELALGVDENEYIHIKGDGKIGIHTNNPSTLLDILASGNSFPLKIRGQDTLNGMIFENGGSSGAEESIYTQDNFMVFTTEGFGRLTIRETGNVGIGTTNPAAKLHIVDGNVQLSPSNLVVANNYGVVSSANPMNFNSASTHMEFSNIGGEKMRITNAGDVGIGTAGPDERLDVAGAVTADAYKFNSNSVANLIIVSVGVSCPGGHVQVAVDGSSRLCFDGG